MEKVRFIQILKGPAHTTILKRATDNFIGSDCFGVGV